MRCRVGVALTLSSYIFTVYKTLVLETFFFYYLLSLKRDHNPQFTLLFPNLHLIYILSFVPIIVIQTAVKP